ncbi:PREDICTED: SWR1-complex protein 5 [Tarenaya hassleriana]|uniref:SWR1-complex protein 5 n=1 Tax=Tarenaya hassleriana TaxID=28532 RepID=UPI00053C6755|nr:PREDICTED: SWR1-complex protein 5 [Tarenaya hassleriana]
MDARVRSMWDEMRKGVSDRSIKQACERYASTVNKFSETRSNKWVLYLGLQRKRKSPGDIDNGGCTVSKKVAEIWEQMNEGLPDKRLNFLLESPSASSIQDASASANLSDNWKMYLGVETKKADARALDVQRDDSVADNVFTEEAKRIAAAALAAVKNASAVAASSGGKVEITEVRDFAGQDIEIKRLVDADSKEASEKGKSSAPSAVDALLEQIKKKQKLSVLDKTKKDWGEFKDENKGLEDELDAYKKSSNQYLDRVSFLERADYRQFEKERDARLALQSKRRPDTRDDL